MFDLETLWRHFWEFPKRERIMQQPHISALKIEKNSTTKMWNIEVLSHSKPKLLKVFSSLILCPFRSCCCCLIKIPSDFSLLVKQLDFSLFSDFSPLWAAVISIGLISKKQHPHKWMRGVLYFILHICTHFYSLQKCSTHNNRRNGQVLNMP